MTARERARNLLNALSRVDDPLARTAYLERYISLYLKLYPDARNLSRAELEAKAWELLQKAAAGDIEIAEEELDKSAVHPELLKYLVEAEEKGQIGPSRQYDIRRLFLQIKQEETQKEDLTKTLDAQDVDRPQDVAENIAETAKRLNEAQLEVGEKGIVNLVRKAGEEVGVFIPEEKGEKIAETLSASPLFRPVLAAPGYQAPPTGRLRPTVQAQEQAAKPAEEQPTPGPKFAFPSEKQILYAAARARKISLFGRIFKSLPIIGKSEEQILKDQLNVYNQAIARLTRLDPQRYSPTSPIITLLQEKREEILGEILQKGEVLKELEFASSEFLEQFRPGFSKKGLRLHELSVYLRTGTHAISPTTFRELFKSPVQAPLRLPRGLALGRTLKNAFSLMARKVSPLFSNPWTYFLGGLGSVFTGIFLPVPSFLRLPLIAGGTLLSGGATPRIPGLNLLPRLLARGGAARIGAFLAAALPSAAVIAKLAGISLIIAFASVGVASFIHLAKNRAVVYEELGVVGGPAAEGSPYISITKSASPTCMNRPGCPGFGTAVYKVSIGARQAPLTNIRVSNDYRVISEGGAPVPAPKIDALSSLPEEISPGQPFQFEYTISLGPEYDDSIVTDTIAVTADAPDNSGISTTGSASVIIGNPPAQCPLPGGTKGDKSYNPGDETKGHGSNAYWERMEEAGDRKCEWRLPQKMCDGPLNNGNVCSKRDQDDKRQFCSFYGYALDVFPSGNTDVIAPNIDGQPVVWSYVKRFVNGSNASAGHSFVYTDTTRKYTLILSHLNGNANTGSNIPSGEKIGSLFPQGSNTHLHMEFQVDGAYQRPEDYFCF